jgi:hypothetical protein
MLISTMTVYLMIMVGIGIAVLLIVLFGGIDGDAEFDVDTTSVQANPEEPSSDEKGTSSEEIHEDDEVAVTVLVDDPASDELDTE